MFEPNQSTYLLYMMWLILKVVIGTMLCFGYCQTKIVCPNILDLILDLMFPQSPM